MAQIIEPQTVQEALNGVHKLDWQQAMQSEYKSLLKNKTWILVDPPLNASIIGTKWIFCRKYNFDGSLSHYKARFVARGFTQREGLDDSETFSPAIKMSSLCVLLALVLSMIILYTKWMLLLHFYMVN